MPTINLTDVVLNSLGLKSLADLPRGEVRKWRDQKRGKGKQKAIERRTRRDRESEK